MTFGESILHFAPEPVLQERLSKLHMKYTTASLVDNTDLTLNIESIDLPDMCFDTVICNHVLEHVDDRLALRQMHRILSPKGQLICSVPLIEGWDHTYENANIKSEHDRELHFDQADHVRLYGRDFRDRIAEAGFSSIQELTAGGGESVKHGLIRGEKIFICTKN